MQPINLKRLDPEFRKTGIAANAVVTKQDLSEEEWMQVAVVYKFNGHIEFHTYNKPVYL